MAPKNAPSFASGGGSGTATAPALQRYQAQKSAAAQLVSKTGTYLYQEVNGFTPNKQDPSGGYYGWTSVGNAVASAFDSAENSVTFAAAGGVSVKQIGRAHV